MSAMKGKSKSDKYIVRVDVATSPGPPRRPRSRLSMASSDGSVINQIQDIESQFQFELGKNFFDRAVQKAQRNIRPHSASTIRSAVPSISSQLSSAHGHKYRIPSLSKGYKSTDKTPIDDFLVQSDDNGVRFEEYIVNGYLDPAAVERKRALERELAEEKELLENQVKNSSQELLFDEEFASELLSELNVDQVDFTEGTFNDIVAGELNDSRLDAVNGENLTDGQLGNHEHGDDSKVTVEVKGDDMVNESSQPEGKSQEVRDNENVLESQQSETGVLKSDDKTTNTDIKSEQTTLTPEQTNKIEDIKQDDKTDNKDVLETRGESLEIDTASVGKKSTKSAKSRSGKKAKSGDKKVTFNEEPEVKRMTPRSAKSPKGKKGRVSPTGKKGGKTPKGSDKKGKKKGGKNKTPTPPPEPSETESQQEQKPEEKPPGEGEGARGTDPEPENKDGETTPEELKEPEKIILDEPPRYCLASEYKSKEQMVREWLHSCSSNAAIRTHPIL